MDPTAGFDPLLAGITFTGSLLSFTATTLVLICFVYYRHEQRSFRHALVFNLALAGKVGPFDISREPHKSVMGVSPNLQ